MDHATYAPQTPRIFHVQGSIIRLPVAELYANTPKTPSKSGKTIRTVQNIKKYGISTPVVVTPTEVFPGVFRYLVIEGEELWHAACLAGEEQIPCLIAQNSPQEADIAAIFAQIAAKTADMFEQAALFRHLTDAYGLTQEEISRRAGLSQSAVANKLRLLHLTAAEQKEILLHGLSERHARALLRLKSPEVRLSILDTVCRKNLSVAATEALVESYIPHKSGDLAQNTGENPINPLKTAVFAPRAEAQPPLTELRAPLTETRVPCGELQDPCGEASVLGKEERAQKFILHTLQPLYNSLERTLNIFRKTGRSAVLESTQGENGLMITIHIPNP